MNEGPDPTSGEHEPGRSNVARRLRAVVESGADADALRDILLWIAGEVEAFEDATAHALAQVAALGERVAASEARQSEWTRALDRVEVFAERAYEQSEGAEARQEERLDQTSRAVRALEDDVRGIAHQAANQDAALAMVHQALDRLSGLAGRIDTLDGRVETLLTLNADLEGIYRELDRVAELTLSRDSTIAEIDDRTTPLATSISALETRLDELAGSTVAAQQEAVRRLTERVEGVAGQAGPVAGLVDEVAALRQELRRVAEEAGQAQQAALAATTEQLGLDGRMRQLEGLPADIEGLYRDFERVMEATSARDDRQGEALRHQTEVGSAVDDLRAQVERLADETRTTELDLRRRLASFESVASDIDSLYREMGRVTAVAGEHADRAASLEAVVAAARDGVAELQGRLEDERVYTTEQVAGLWARLRSMEELPADLGGVKGELESLTESVRRAFGDSSETLDGIERRVHALEGMPGELERVAGELEALADEARARHEQLAGIEARLDPLSTALSEVRAEVDRLAAADAKLAGIDERMAKVDALPATVDAALRDLTRTSDELTANHQATLASATVLLEDFHDRIRALESLPADMEGLYAALYRLAESVKELRASAPT